MKDGRLPLLISSSLLVLGITDISQLKPSLFFTGAVKGMESTPLSLLIVGTSFLGVGVHRLAKETGKGFPGTGSPRNCIVGVGVALRVRNPNGW